MPTVVTHSIVAIAGGKIFPPHEKPNYFWLLTIFCVILPDIDVIGYTHLFIPYNHFWGHRGFLHSPFFAFILSAFIVGIFFRQLKLFSKLWWQYFLYFFLLTASHGVLDAFTDGGYGVALLSPFDNTRYFFPWTPIRVSPLSVQAIFSQRGITVFVTEILWIWLPVILFVTLVKIYLRKKDRPTASKRANTANQSHLDFKWPSVKQSLKSIGLIPLILAIYWALSARITFLENYQPESPTQKALKEVLLQFQEGINSKNEHQIGRLLHTNAELMVGRNRQLLSRNEYIQILSQRLTGSPTVRLSTPKIRISGDKATAKIYMWRGNSKFLMVIHMLFDNYKWLITGWDY